MTKWSELFTDEIAGNLGLSKTFFLDFDYNVDENDIRKAIKRLNKATKVAEYDYIPGTCILETH